MNNLEEDKLELERVMIKLIEVFETAHPGVYVRRLTYGGAHIENGRYLFVGAEVK